MVRRPRKQNLNQLQSGTTGNADPAFACAAENGHQPGMTLRQYYASAAMAALIVRGDIRSPAEIAAEAFTQADAMIEFERVEADASE
jgi:hypothetical protein